ncbi:MAG: glucose-6-phosphate isomerase [Methanomicrobiales archaeon]|nr:glucose-6-phosphate isomerase [Methanomicrobiales archaeon]
MQGWEGELPPPSVRTLADMKSVLQDPTCVAGEEPLYFMYRDVARSGADRQWLRERNLRYDLTVIPPRDLCGEWVKTKGHYHPENAAGVGYPEVYEVLAGRAHYLLQARVLDDIILIAAEAGDLVVMPPGYGHITINPTPDQTLVMANIVSCAFESEYREYESLHGAAYYEQVNGDLVKNPHYPRVPPVRRIRQGSQAGAGRILDGPLYSLIGNEKALGFLNRPEEAAAFFTALR